MKAAALGATPLACCCATATEPHWVTELGSTHPVDLLHLSGSVLLAHQSRDEQGAVHALDVEGTEL